MKKNLEDFTPGFKQAVDEAKEVLCVKWEGLWTLFCRKYPSAPLFGYTIQLMKNAYQGRANNAAMILTPLIESLYKPATDDSIGVISNEAS